MADFTIQRTVEVRLTPEDCAKCFASMHDEEQAQFFVALAREVKLWQSHPGMQWLKLADELLKLDPEGEAREMIKEIAGYVAGEEAGR